MFGAEIEVKVAYCSGIPRFSLSVSDSSSRDVDPAGYVTSWLLSASEG
jgi:hypothetical protein